jgi:lysophospholipase L1-like esterase
MSKFFFQIGTAVYFLCAAFGLSDDVRFVDGDNWCAIGDSITHGGDYHKDIYLYYVTRFPRERINLFNCGIGGDTAPGTLRRMEYDIMNHKPTVATIILGMNDVWWVNNKNFTMEESIRDLEVIVDRLQNAGSRVILFTPSIYDKTVQSDREVDIKRNGLDRFAQAVRELADQKKLPCIDLFDFMCRSPENSRRRIRPSRCSIRIEPIRQRLAIL